MASDGGGDGDGGGGSEENIFATAIPPPGPPRQDRTGFIEFFALSGILVAISLLIFYIEYSKISVLFALVGVVVFVTAEGTSRPPRMGPHEFVKEREILLAKKKRDGGDAEEVLVCLGDSLTHGACSANWVDALTERLRGSPSAAPLAIVNAGQNGICTETVLQRKVEHVIACRPKYIFIMIGTNDVRAVYRKDWGDQLTWMWSLTERPSEDALMRNLANIIRVLLEHTTAKIAVGTLPPLGEDADSTANQIVLRVNRRIIHAVEIEFCDSRRVSAVDVNGALWKYINLSSVKRKKIHSIDDSLPIGIVMCILHNIFGLSWNLLTHIITGNVVLSESLHLNETGGDVVRNELVKWLVENGDANHVDGRKEKLL
eukprot:CAMPEP_0181125022 /NCGR_PEP_ID=MMETSP1071-20121207/26816_1 /TAXON_ID=35127 /ORGANISM="Thalassiosira sp., Strain NH16" /LENGTH=372 /DNA_ID=CAMNT_0023210413 /DNA_START=86 /DNA_END=1204 /DNA_ORIENTATION=+